MQTTANTLAGNDPFMTKRAILAKSPYELTRMVGQQDEWTPEAIKERQEVLANLAVKAWPI